MNKIAAFSRDNIIPAFSNNSYRLNVVRVAASSTGFVRNFTSRHPPITLATISANHDAVYRESIRDPAHFWGELGHRRLRWVKRFTKTMECNMAEGKFRWFIDGKLNATGKQRDLYGLFQLIIVRPY